jgi:uncharacterized protein YbjT (DUF2867 family)
MSDLITPPLLVTGGTGTLGRLVVPRLRAAGCDVRVLSRGRHEASPGLEFVTGDLATGEGVADAVAGTEIVVHLAGSSRGDDVKARHLAAAAAAAGVRHLVTISVVGADRVPMAGLVDRALFGYYGAKLAAERVVAGSGVPWTTLRASQFHELVVATARQLARLPVVPVPAGFQVQPVAAAEVAELLATVALGPPSGLVPDIAGPRAYPMGEVVRDYLSSVGKRRALVPVRFPGLAARALRHGANLAPGRAVGRRTWEDHLAARAAARPAGAVEPSTAGAG